MSAIGVITNPKSRQNRRDPVLARRLAYVLGDPDQLAAPTDLESLQSVVARFRERGVEVVAINGGDGSVHTVLTALAREWGDAPLPKIALLRGGTMNTLAHGLGITGSPEQLLGELVAAWHARQPLAYAERTALRVDGEQIGFLFGNGLIARFLEAWYADPEPSPASAVWLLARAVLSAMVQGPLIRELMRPWEGSVEVDGVDWPCRAYLTVAAGGVDDIGVGFRPFFRCLDHPGQMHALGLTCSPWAVSRELWRIWRAKPMKYAERHEAVARRLVLRSSVPIAYMVDGDFHQAGAELVVETGPRVQFWLPGR